MTPPRKHPAPKPFTPTKKLPGQWVLRGGEFVKVEECHG
jgi:hypothetical protein